MAVQTACPTCGGEADHAPRATATTSGTIHHPGPDWLAPVTVYVKVTAQPTRDERFAPADLAAAVVEVLGRAIVVGEVEFDTTVRTSRWAYADDWSGEPQRPTPLACGCEDATEHDEGVRLQNQTRADFRIASLMCVGCVLGDDGPSMHSCAIHPTKAWA